MLMELRILSFGMLFAQMQQKCFTGLQQGYGGVDRFTNIGNTDCATVSKTNANTTSCSNQHEKLIYISRQIQIAVEYTILVTDLKDNI